MTITIDLIKQKILDKAMRGELVEQDANDESVEVILEKIEEERQRLIDENKIRKQRSLPSIEKEELPYKLPRGWKWVRLGDIGEWKSGSTPSRSNSKYYNGNIPWLKTGELKDNFIYDSQEKISELALKETSLRLNKPGDVLIAMYGATIGKLGILKVEATTNQACCACTPFNGVHNKFLFYYLRSIRQILKSKAAGGAQPNISREKIVNTIFPLPPYSEQKRIVDKIDLLFNLCDNWEKEVEKQQKYLIALREKVLDDAMKGLLVEQDDNDEPAELLIKKIKEEKQKLIKEKKIRKQKPLKIIEEEFPYRLPNGWKWELLDNIALIRRGASPRPIKSFITESNDGIPWIKIGDAKEGSKYITSTNEKITEDGAKKSVYLKSGSLILSNSMSYGKAYILGLDGCIHDGWLSFEVPDEYINKEWLLYFLNGSFAQFESKAVGTGVKNLNIDRVRSTYIPVPPLKEQKRIVEKIEEITTYIDKLESQIISPK